MTPLVVGRVLGLRVPAALFLLCVVNGVAGEPRSITVESGRPVAAAVKELEARFAWPITYEDPPYAHADEIVDVPLRSAGIRRAADGSWFHAAVAFR
jgi:hypothetical protein